MSKGLVIVESPTKIKALKSFLGSDYDIQASMGHIIDLPVHTMGVDVNNNFKPEYIVLPLKRKTLKLLKDSIKDNDTLWLATDPDREGEAISWHLSNALGEGKKVYRVEFHEITSKAVQDAFKHPRSLDMKLIDAQQARRVLDRIVGYNLSPLLWAKVSKGLSAGRVQSIAVRLIVEREKQITEFKPDEYWSCEVLLSSKKDKKSKFTALLDKKNNEKIKILNKKQADELVLALRDKKYIVSDVKKSKKNRSVSAAYTTSKLQQDGFNQLKFPVSRTMRTAQSLYEGVELPGEGVVGLITYMRTDSVNVSQGALDEVRDFISKNFSKEYLPKVANVFKSKKSAQEAHEAIRPTSVFRKPEDIKEYLSKEQFKLYELIWRKFVSSQMTPALFESTQVEVKADEYTLKASGQKLLFDGFMVVYRENENEEDDKENILPELSVSEECSLVGIEPRQHFTKPPARFSDASLVKTLEELGIGRPSTYAPTISTIVDRNYVERRSGYFYATELGVTVNNLLVEHFPKILDMQFTAHFEEELDKVEEGSVNWIDVMKEFYQTFSSQLSQAEVNMKEVKKHEEVLDEKCPKCSRTLVIKWGRLGRFISCPGFPKCKYARSIASDIKCPEPDCKGFLVRRRSKKGRFFYGCSEYPKCTHITNKIPNKAKDESEESSDT